MCLVRWTRDIYNFGINLSADPVFDNVYSNMFHAQISTGGFMIHLWRAYLRRALVWTAVEFRLCSGGVCSESDSVENISARVTSAAIVAVSGWFDVLTRRLCFDLGIRLTFAQISTRWLKADRVNRLFRHSSVLSIVDWAWINNRTLICIVQLSTCRSCPVWVPRL